MKRFGGATREWFKTTFGKATPVQVRGWAEIGAGRHTLMLAPTGSGKTLAAFLSCIDALLRGEHGSGYSVVYISPIKALAYDIERNLRKPLTGIAGVAKTQGASLRPIVVDVRTGDTATSERRRQLREPGDILITTPESLFILLGSTARETLRTVRTVIVDEIHVLAPNKRGAHLSLSLERLSAICAEDPQRIGLSATQRPLEEVARYLGGDRPVAIVDTAERQNLVLEITVPVADMRHPTEEQQIDVSVSTPDAKQQRGVWPAVYRELLALVHKHSSTILFVNSRRMAERVTHQLNILAEQELVRAHHGSMAWAQRRETETLLKQGQLRGIVATSSLELGIDMGAVDLVIQIESPKSVSRGLQRFGRAGHHVGQTSNGRFFPKFRGDLLETVVVAQRMLAGDIEPVRIPRNALDVLAQQIVAICAERPVAVEAIERLVRRTYGYATLSRRAFDAVLDMLSGRFPADEFADLRPRIDWDRNNDVVQGRRGAKMLSLTNAGTIPDRGTYSVHIAGQPAKIGELDEEMVFETRTGEVILLGASSWRVEEITRDRVMVSPAPGVPGKMPFWRGDGPGRPVELGRAVGAFTRELASTRAQDAIQWLTESLHVDAYAANNLVGYIDDQRDVAGVVPSDNTIVIERCMDELGDWRVCILSPFGARVHAPWALVIEDAFSQNHGFAVQTLWSDDGIVLRFSDCEALPDVNAFIPDPEEIEDRLTAQLSRSALFASHFRENAARALLLPRRRVGARSPLWAQRIKAKQLLAVALRFSDFPIVIETYRECLQDVFDVPALVDLLNAIRERKVRVVSTETTAPSPFARSLIFDYVAAYLYEGDAPLAERRAHALTLDRALLRELMGKEALRELLDIDIIGEVTAQLQGLHEDYRCNSAESVHDMLRRIGDLTGSEIAQRCIGDSGTWTEALVASGHITAIDIAGEQRYIAMQDVGRYRDAFGIAPPLSAPDAFLAVTEQPLERIVLRWARYRGPVVATDLVRRYGLTSGQTDTVLRLLEQRGELLCDAFLPQADGTLPEAHGTREWCHPETLRRIKRRTLAKYRNAVEPVKPAVFAMFLAERHGVRIGDADVGRGSHVLREAIEQIQGVPLSFSELERVVLPARVGDYHPKMLDELGSMGEIVWVGCAPLGEKDGKVALYRRENLHLLRTTNDETAVLAAPIPRMVFDYLSQRGASFLTAVHAACGQTPFSDVVAALWQLVWAGLVTNDTFEPLRGLSRPSGRARKRMPLIAGGRWSCVEDLQSVRGNNDTTRLHAQVMLLLQRYGMVGRDIVVSDGAGHNFNAMVQLLRAMEDAGHVRRGHFIHGIGGMLFAQTSAVDRMRALRDQGEGAVTILSAVDPANAYGAAIAWPQTRIGAKQPTRRAGALVVGLNGSAVCYLTQGGKKLITFAHVDQSTLKNVLPHVANELFRISRKRSMRVDLIDGQQAAKSWLAEALVDVGFQREYPQLVIYRRV